MTSPRNTQTFPLTEELQGTIKEKMLSWVRRFSIFVLLDTNGYGSEYGRYECLLAADPLDIIAGDEGDLLTRADAWHQANKDWLFGHICYDYKNQLEPKLVSSHRSGHPFSSVSFFQPRTVCYIARGSNSLTIATHEPDAERVFQEIVESNPLEGEAGRPVRFRHRISKEAYLDAIGHLRKHIEDGDCYEINFCSEGYCEAADIDPLATFRKLNALSPAPFAACYRNGQQYLMCASPERYILKKGREIISQPIKGTARRDPDPKADERIKQELKGSIKEQAENVMIVDLVRNDLSRTCQLGSIDVKELFGIYSFPQVHQMISTVYGLLRADTTVTEPIRHSFPMGSMTGAPKYRVMQLIEQYEYTRRGLFSGSVGYINPGGDFDFNVIIRSLFYNAETKYLSYQTGGAITYDSDPLQEWEEMRLKAWALEKVLA